MLRTLGLCGLFGLSALMLGACVGAPEPGSEGQGPDVAPDGKGIGVLASDTSAIAESKAQPASATANITNHGGPVMSTGVNVYIIWYGKWSTSNPGGQTVVTNFLSSLGGSPYFGINTSYGVANSVTLAGQTTDSGTSTKLSDANIKTIVTNAITSARLPKDAKGLYFVLTSREVNETSGFCTQYCGWHTNASISGTDIKYSFVGDAARCIASCAAQSNGPNGNPGADGMVSVIAHELEETATDEDLNAWYDSSGAENGDKCAWTFGTEYTAANGTLANMSLGGHDYLIQQNWKADTQACGLK